MDKIIVTFQPFTNKQNVIVYQNNEITEQLQIDLNDVISVVKGLVSKYNIKSVDMFGNKEFLSKYRAEIGGTDYAMGLIDINIIER